MSKRVLVACEYSARVRDAFRVRGFDAWSCDLLATDSDPRWHIQGDAVSVAYGYEWDCLIAFPPCTHLSVIGAAQWEAKQSDGRQQQSLGFVRALMSAPVAHIAVENPVGRISTAIRRPDQIIQPWQFGDPWTKRTCLWLKDLPPLLPAEIVEPGGFWVGGGSKKDGRSVSQEGARSNRTGRDKYADIAHDRNKTFQGIANAMAEQWGDFLDGEPERMAA
jgi:hypothetical protein